MVVAGAAAHPEIVVKTRWTLAAVLALTACRTVRYHYGSHRTGAGVYPPYEGPVTVSRTAEPGGVALAVVQVYARNAPGIDALLAELTQEASRLGADYVKVDRLSTRFETVDVEETESYECGTPEVPQTCTRTRTHSEEVATTQVVGRAFRTAP